MPFAFCLLFHSISTQPLSASCFSTRSIPVDRWRGEYFNNPDLSSVPAMVRDDTQAGNRFLDFDWKLGSPGLDCGISVDRFSVRWMRTVALAAGSYRFTVTSDDGVRLFIDGQERLNQWNDHPLATHSVDILLTAGNHKIVLEYYERWGSAEVSLTWKQHPCIATVPSDHWRGEYFNNETLNGQPAVVRGDGDGQIYFDWRAKSPEATCGIPANNFSARWSRRAPFGSGIYRFEVSADGGARVLIDGQVRFDQWRGASAVQSFFDLVLEAGNHQIVFEYRSGTDRSNAGLSWKPLPCIEQVADDHWRGEYFNSDNLSGAPAMVRDDG
ncbi:MAG: PA14 domain-containing protein, partial [Acidobacteriota bacterium]|nr:PA14 domain-containing protein [Acidobacteriota bacterium]